MFAKIATFELRYQLKNPVFWVAAGLFFLLTFGSVTIDQIQIGGRGATHVNSPYAIATTLLTLQVFFMFVTTAFVANVVVRDDDTGFGPILRATRVDKASYLFGRFTGACVAACLAFAFVPLAMMLGAAMPWLDPEKVGAFRPGDYLFVYLVFSVPTIFATGAIFFALATVTRSMMATYLGVVALLVLFLISQAVLSKLELRAVQPWTEPFGAGAMAQATRYFTTAERNTRLPPLTGVVLGNRAEWIGIGLAALGAAFALFRTEARGAKRRREALAEAAPAPRAPTALGAPAAQSFGMRAGLAQLWLRARFEMALVFRSPAFFVLMAIGLLNAVAQLWFSDGAYGSAIHPATRVMIQDLRGAFTIIPTIVAIYYAGELVWRDRDRRMEGLVDSTPAPDWSFAAPKMLAIALVLGAMLAISVVAAVGVQLLKGYTQLRLDEYFTWYLLPETIDAAQLAILAVFVQALSPHKYVGWMVMVLYLVATLVMAGLGWEDNLYQYGAGPSVPLSDMNGASVSGGARWWFRAYWSAGALILAVLAYALWRRGAQTALRPRLRRLPQRLSGAGGGVLAAAAVVMAGLGGFIFLNTHVWNPYRTHLEAERWQADYEKTLLKYEHVPQPKIQSVKLDVALDPDRRLATTRGVYLIRNTTPGPIAQLHLRFDRDLDVRSLSVDGARPLTTFKRFNYRIFGFDTPMLPGETRRVAFETVRGRRGFRNDTDDTRVVRNGTFLNDGEIAPRIGMDRDGLMRDRAKRRKYHLPPDLRMPKLEDLAATRFNVLRHDSDWVQADITVSTRADQTPIAPGYKVSDVTANGRRTARFRTDAPVMNFFSIQSARYAQKHVAYKGVDLGVFYDAAHPWNVDRMISALQRGLDYDQASFSPYQFRQVRILEFPDYAQFAQSFANTIPYSEGIGFLFAPPADPVKAGKIDMVTYVTAHELGHQWWAHQEMPSDQQGSAAVTETLAQWTALMNMEHRYGRYAMPMFLRYERDSYLRARGSEVVEELPLERVEDQGYIHYRKGSLVMFRLKEVLGEGTVNRALHRFVTQFAFKPPPYARSVDFVTLLRQEAGPDPVRQSLITDLWEKITLYDVKAKKAVWARLPDGRARVTLTFDAKKLYADGQGRERAVAFREALPLGVLRAGAKPNDGWDEFSVPVHDGLNTVTVETRSAYPVGKVEIDPVNAMLIKTPSDKDIVATAR